MSTATADRHMEQVTANFRGSVRRETLNGREYLVAPLSMITEGVLNGSKGALFYPRSEFSKDPAAWNNIPIVVYHPEENGQPVSARHPSILEKQGIGYVFNATVKGKLRAEGWFDIEKTNRVDKRILINLQQRRPMELSTGLFTDNEPKKGVFNGRNYDFIARHYRPDHLAILPDKKGACSIEDGCGVNVNQEDPVTKPTENEKKSLWAKLGEMLGITSNENCGTGAGGFQPGNTCAAGDKGGGGGGGRGPSTRGGKLLAKHGFEEAGGGTRSGTGTGGGGIPGDEAFTLYSRGSDQHNFYVFEGGRWEHHDLSKQKDDNPWSAQASGKNSKTLQAYTEKLYASKKSGGGGKSKPVANPVFAGLSLKTAMGMTNSPAAKGLSVKIAASSKKHGGKEATVVEHNPKLGSVKVKIQGGGTVRLDHSRVIINEDGHSGSSETFEGETDMAEKKLTDNERKELVTALVANCSCQDEKKETEEKLNKLSDGTLKELAENALPPQFAKKSKKKPMEGDEESTCNEEEEVVANEAKPLTTKEWLKTAPPEVRSIVVNQLKRDRKVKARLIEQIVANDRNTFSKEMLEGMSTEQLEPIAALAGPTKNDDELDELFRPHYAGAAAPLGNQLSEKDSEEDILPLPVANWAEWNKEDRKKA